MNPLDEVFWVMNEDGSTEQVKQSDPRRKLAYKPGGFEKHRRVAHDVIPLIFDEIEVSTVFLMVDDNLFGDGDPILFETMIFGGEHDQTCVRYRTRDEAAAGHRLIVRNLNDHKEDPFDGVEGAW
jgi:hypothetical protein